IPISACALSTYRHTLALISASTCKRIRECKCVPEVEGVGAKRRRRSRRPFEYNGPAEPIGIGRRTESQLGERPFERSGLRLVPKQIVNRRVRDGRCKA